MFFYLDRTLVSEDTILGVDNLAKFNTQAKIEMYMENSEVGFGGERTHKSVWFTKLE